LPVITIILPFSLLVLWVTETHSLIDYQRQSDIQIHIHITMFGTWKYDPETDEVQSVRNGFDPVTARSSSHQACDRCHEKKVHLPHLPGDRVSEAASFKPGSTAPRAIVGRFDESLFADVIAYSFDVVETRTAVNDVGATVFVASTLVQAPSPPRRRAIASPQTTRAFPAQALVEGAAVRPSARASTTATQRE
jgi:hypothetical protein